MFNGFFGQISGDFKANVDIFNLIKQQHAGDLPIDHISKIGIHYPVNFNLKINPNDNSSMPSIFVSLFDQRGRNNQIFQLGKTGMLELQDVSISSIKFLSDVENIYIDYQYE